MSKSLEPNQTPEPIVAPGYYTIVRPDDFDDEPTVCHVLEDEHEVEIMHFTPGYTRADVFGPSARFRVLAGPWELPR